MNKIATKQWLIEVYLSFARLCFILFLLHFSMSKISVWWKNSELFFKMCCIFDQKISPILWILYNASRFHSKVFLRSYWFGLSHNTMRYWEQKHKLMSKSSENITLQNGWSMIFCHEDLQLNYLTLNGYNDIKYTQNNKLHSNK